MQNFEDFPDHITEHINHYDCLASFMQPCANIAKIKTFRESMQRWPQSDSVITSWEEQNPNVLTRDFQDFTTYLPQAQPLFISRTMCDRSFMLPSLKIVLD